MPHHRFQISGPHAAINHASPVRSPLLLCFLVPEVLAPNLQYTDNLNRINYP